MVIELRLISLQLGH